MLHRKELVPSFSIIHRHILIETLEANLQQSFLVCSLQEGQPLLPSVFLFQGRWVDTGKTKLKKTITKAAL